MNLIFIDIETNGLPKDYKAPMTKVDNWPRVIELGWQVADDSGLLIHEFSSLIKPDGWEIPKDPFWIDHGFTTERNISEGLEMPGVLDSFLGFYNDCDVFVAHNLAFDYPILGAELLRYGKRGAANTRRVKFCTMEVGTNVCKIPFGNDHRPWKNKSWKFPKLTELYKKLFECELQKSHDASSDVTACRLCFFELVKRGVIELPKTEVA